MKFLCLQHFPRGYKSYLYVHDVIPIGWAGMSDREANISVNVVLGCKTRKQSEKGSEHNSLIIMHCVSNFHLSEWGPWRSMVSNSINTSMGPTETSSKEDRLYKMADNVIAMSANDAKIFSNAIFSVFGARALWKREKLKPRWNRWNLRGNSFLFIYK